MEVLVNLIIGSLTAIIVQVLKKIKLPSKFAPTIVLVVAGVIVAIANALGFTPDINSIKEAILTAIGIGGGTALAYDQVKKLGEPK